jgi:cycloeucalenol cycloisomerase
MNYFATVLLFLAIAVNFAIAATDCRGSGPSGNTCRPSGYYSPDDTRNSMIMIFGAILLALFLCASFLTTPRPAEKGKSNSSNSSISFFSGFLPDSSSNAIKYQFEVWALCYSGVWIAAFGYIILSGWYKDFNKDNDLYMKVCGTLSLPYLLQPILWPLDAEKNLPLTHRYSFKANVWIAIFSFIGNYWYTHYFYSVLGARYTFPALRLNDVPICLYFATHFYFVTYHTLSNMLLRKLESAFLPNGGRKVFFWGVVVAFAYFTAFMETLTISGFDKYCFSKPIHEIYTKGSAFYGIYFLVSYPVFYEIDEKTQLTVDGVKPFSIKQVVLEAMGSGMIVLLLLDFCRILLKEDLKIDGINNGFCYYEQQASNK